MLVLFGDRIKQERERRNWSQNDLAEKLFVSRQSVSKWEQGKNYPSIEVLIALSDLFSIPIDELLRGDQALKQKVIKDGKQLAYPKTKAFFDSLVFLGLLLLLLRFVLFIVTKLLGIDIGIMIPNGLAMNAIPAVLMIVGAIGSHVLKEKFKE